MEIVNFIDNICRLCLRKCDAYAIHMDSHDSAIKNLQEKIKECLSIEISNQENSMYTRFICYDCICKLDYFQEFRISSLKSQAYLHEMLQCWDTNAPGIVVVSDKRPVLQEISFPENGFILDDEKSQFNHEYNEIIQSLEKEDLNFSKISDVELVELQVENKPAFNYCLDDLVDDLRDSAESAPVFTELQPHIPDDRSTLTGIQTPNIRDEEQECDFRQPVHIHPSDEYDARLIQGNPPLIESQQSTEMVHLNVNQYHIQPIQQHETFSNEEVKEEECENEVDYEDDFDDDDEDEDDEKSEPQSKPETSSSSSNMKTNRSLSCEVCAKTFQSISKLKIHLTTHSDSPKFACEMEGCKKTFKSKIGLQEHMAKHTGQYDHFCEICGKGFINRSYLIGHQRIHSNAKPFNCSICGQTFKAKQAMIDHKNRHLGLKPFACQATNCDKRFTTKFLLIQHEKEHTDSTEKFTCSICSKEFNSKNYLKSHQKLHKNDRKFKCEVCDKGFMSNYDLKLHFTLHSGEKKFVCEICGKDFARKDALKGHRRTHTGEKPFKCNICGQGFNQYTPMMKHQLLHNNDSERSLKSLKCDQCPKTFVSKSTMKLHMKKHHNTVDEV